MSQMSADEENHESTKGRKLEIIFRPFDLSCFRNGKNRMMLGEYMNLNLRSSAPSADE
jgi:hypothetical protein